MSEDGKHNHVIATDIVRLRSVDASETNSMDQIAMCTMGKHGFRQSLRCVALKQPPVTCLSSNLELTSLACEVTQK